VGQFDEKLARWRLREGVVDPRLDGQPHIVQVERGTAGLARMCRVDGGILQHLAHIAMHELEQLRHHPRIGCVGAHRFEDLGYNLGVSGKFVRFGHLIHQLHAGLEMVVRMVVVVVVRVSN